jgi:hypothetical protein
MTQTLCANFFCLVIICGANLFGGGDKVRILTSGGTWFLGYQQSYQQVINNSTI